MKKWIALLLTLTLMFVFVGCGGKEPENPDNPDDPDKPTEVLPETITISGQKETMTAGETLTLSVEVLPATTTNKAVTWKSSNDAVVKVDANGGITAVAAGTATITVTSRAKSSVKAEVTITVEAVKVDITGLTITGRTEVEVGKSIALAVNALPAGASKEVTWSVSDEKIATIDAIGKLIGVAEGTVKVTATSTDNTSISAQYDVTVKPASGQGGGEGPVKVTSIDVTATSETVEEGWKVQFTATCYPEGSNQNVIWHSRKEEVATIDEKGFALGVKAGTTYIYATSAEDETIQSGYVKLVVKADETAGIAYPDMQGYVIKIMNASSALQDIDPFLDGYTAQNKIFKQQAWTEVKKDYNCGIEVVAYPDEAPWGTDRINWINAQSEAGTAQADFYIISSPWLYKLAQTGAAHNATEYYNKWGKNAMTASEKGSATYKKQLYALSTGIDETKNYIDIGLFYNYGMLKKLNIKSPAEIFNEGNWTYSEFKKWAESAQALMETGSYAIAGHPYYYWLGMTNAAGVKILDVNSVKNNVSTARPKAAAALLRELCVSGAFDPNYTWAESSGSFVEGKALLTSGCYWFIRDSGRWTATCWGEGNTEFGFVPFPRPDDVTLEQTRYSETGTTLYMMAGNREGNHKAGMTYEDVYRAMNDTFLRTSKYYQNDPTYDAEGLKRTAAESKLDDPASVEALMFFTAQNVFYDAVHGFYDSISGSPMGTNLGNIVVKGNDYDAEMDEDMAAYDGKFIEVFGA